MENCPFMVSNKSHMKWQLMEYVCVSCAKHSLLQKKPKKQKTLSQWLNAVRNISYSLSVQWHLDFGRLYITITQRSRLPFVPSKRPCSDPLDHLHLAIKWGRWENLGD